VSTEKETEELFDSAERSPAAAEAGLRQGGGDVTDSLLAAVEAGVRVFDLGRPMFVGMPQSPVHPTYWHTLTGRHDVVRPDGGAASSDLVVTGTHVGTHIDALAHASQDGRLHGGADAWEAGRGGRYLEHGVHTIAPMVRRGVLLDVPSALGAVACEPAYEITPEDLEAAASKSGVKVRTGDVVLIRSGWGRRFGDGSEAYNGTTTGAPGVGEAGAKWLAAAGILAAGADTIAFERVGPRTAGTPPALFPAHRVLLVESGVYIIEALDLEELSAVGCVEFTFVLSPLRLMGATGSPVRPLAVVAAH
jgi:kynurenine formamidase